MGIGCRGLRTRLSWRLVTTFISLTPQKGAQAVRESQSTWASIQTDIDKANSLRVRANEARNAAIAELQLAKEKAGAARASISIGAPSYSNTFNLGEQAKQEARMRDYDAEIAKQEAIIKQNNEVIRLKRGERIGMEVAAQYDKGAAAALRYDKTLDSLNNRLRAGKISESQYREELSKATAAKEAANASEGRGERAGRARVARMSAEARAIQQQTQETERFIESLQDEIARIGLDEKALRQLEIAKQSEAATTQKQRDAIAALNVKREEALALAEAEKAAKTNAEIAKDITKAERELALIGLTGAAREKATIAIAEQAEIEAVLVEMQKAEADGNIELMRQLTARIDLIQKKYDVERQGVDIADQARKDADSLELVNDQLRDMIGLLGGLGKVGQAVGGLLDGLMGGSFAGMGAVGVLLDKAGMSEAERRKQADMIADKIGEQFGVGSEFAKMIGGALQGASTGALLGDAIGGKKASNIGAVIGAIAGEEFMSAISGPLAAASAANQVIGDIFGFEGGPLGMLSMIDGIKKDASAWSNLSTDARGNVVSNYSTSAGKGDTAGRDSLAGAAMDVLEQIAGAFGGSLQGGVQLGSIGVRKGQAVTDWTPGTKEGRNYYSSPEEAVKAFVAHALEVGVLGGVKAGTLTLLKRTGDLEKNLADALSFEGVFKELAAIKDPLGAAFADLNKQAADLRRIFADASATVAEYAQLEEYLSLKRQEVIDAQTEKAAQDFQERADLEVELLRLLGREQEALNLAREAELSGLKSSLKPLQQMIYTLQDARAIIDQFGPLADDLRAYKAELLGGTASGSFGFLKQQFQSVSAMAANGDAAAMAKLQSVSDSYLEAARENASSKLEYDRAVGEVLGAVDKSIFAADTKVDYAQAQIDAVNHNTEILDQMRSQMAAMQQRLVDQGEAMNTLMRRWETSGVPLRAEDDNPIYVTVAP